MATSISNMDPKDILQQAIETMHDPQMIEQMAMTDEDRRIAENIRKKIEKYYKSTVYDKAYPL